MTRNTSGPKGARTPDLMAASHALYQLSYGPGSGQSTRRFGWSSVCDLRPPPTGRCGIPCTFLRSTKAADAGSALVTGGGVMSEMLMKGLTSTKRELEAGVADAEAELARTEEYCRKLEELIAVGKATLHAASQMPLPQMSQMSQSNGVTVVPDADLAKDRK